MSDATFLPVSLGLAAAISWGAADFTGGMATKRSNVYGVVIGGELTGLVVLFVLALLTGEPVPSLQNMLVAGLAGIGGGFGLILLYRALAGGQMSVAAPVSAVLAAAIPVIVAAVWQGFPDPIVMGGLLLALLAIWLIASGEGSEDSLRIRLEHIRLPFLAGIIFGLFFVLLHHASQDSLYWPIIATRLASVTFLIGFATFTRQVWTPQRRYWPIIALSGILDTGGNGLYVLSGQVGRMDVAAVLSSLYPGATVLLAWIILREKMGRLQWIGFICALFAIIMITL